MVLRLLDRVVCRRWRDEVGGNELGTLVDELVERVLSIRAGGTPDNRLSIMLVIEKFTT